MFPDVPECSVFLVLSTPLIYRGGSRGGPRGAQPPPPYFETKLRPEGLKTFLGDRPPTYLRIWMTATPPPPHTHTPPPNPCLKVWIRH